jgi:hypothetical protein
LKWLRKISEALFSIGFSEFRLWEFSKVANSGTQPSFFLELVDLGIAFWISVQKFGKVCTLCGENLGILFLFLHSFEFLLLQVSMVVLPIELFISCAFSAHYRQQKKLVQRNPSGVVPIWV